MKKYFDLVLDLLELEEKAELLELAERLSEASERGEKVVIAFPLLQEGQETSKEFIEKLKT